MVLSAIVQCADYFMELFDAVLWSSSDEEETSKTKERDDDKFKSTFLDKLIASTPRLLVVANAFLLLTYLLHGALADFFLGPVRTTDGAAVGNGGADTTVAEDGARLRNHAEEHIRQRRGREKLLGYLLFKVLLVSSVVTPDVCEFFVVLYAASIESEKS
jgi:hypothetical protein